MRRHARDIRLDRRLASAVAIAAITTIASPVRAQEQWQAIDCKTAAFALDDDARCQRVRTAVGSASVETIVSELYRVNGRRGNREFGAVYWPPPPQASHTLREWAAYSVKESEVIIREIAEGTAREMAGPLASQFGAYRGFGHTGLMQYRVGQRHCVAFDHGYPVGSGYEYFVRGAICSATALDDPEKVVRDFLAAVRITAPGSGVSNAFGAAPVALAWAP
jgi:hypothetical protein